MDQLTDAADEDHALVPVQPENNKQGNKVLFIIIHWVEWQIEISQSIKIINTEAARVIMTFLIDSLKTDRCHSDYFKL